MTSSVATDECINGNHSECTGHKTVTKTSLKSTEPITTTIKCECYCHDSVINALEHGSICILSSQMDNKIPKIIVLPFIFRLLAKLFWRFIGKRYWKPPASLILPDGFGNLKVKSSPLP